VSGGGILENPESLRAAWPVVLTARVEKKAGSGVVSRSSLD
jgi:hypothetical protein